MILALAGRRVDAADAKETRFPLQNLDLVRTRVREMFEREQVTAIVSSAACGADLIALSQAGRLGLRRRVVLPFSRDRFRESSVADRPGEWGPVYDKVLDDVEPKGDLVVMGTTDSHDDAYAAANLVIIDEALRLGSELHLPVIAALVWDGESRGHGDLTEQFGNQARRRGLRVLEVKTI